MPRVKEPCGQTEDVELHFHAKVEGKEIVFERHDCNAALEDTGAGQMAARLIGILDRKYTREQVYAIACWMKYLATQG